jgi:hypothetical protein
MTKAVYYTPCSFEQQVVKHNRLIHAKLIKRIWQSKYHMEVGYRQQFFFSCLYPIFALFALAFGTMTVTATVITYTKQATTAATIYMTT